MNTTISKTENHFLFKPLALEHIPLLHKWMQEPHVRQWWGEGKTWTLDKLNDKYSSYTQGYKIENGSKKPISAFIIQLQERPIGYIQTYNAFDFPRKGFNIEQAWPDLSKPLAALDFYIGEPDCIGLGIGSDALQTFLKQHIFPNFDGCLVDPEKGNKAAIKAYAKAGFSTILELPSNIVMIAPKEQKKNPLIIFGSARSDGHTLRAIQATIGNCKVPVADLRKLNIAHYDYNYENADDDFIPLAEKMVQHNPIILATPVYWYTMSALMKIFIDRWSDLLHLRKDIGRRLANKELYVIASYGESIPRGFEEAFSQTCDYMEMQYKGCFYFYSGNDSELVNKNTAAAESFFRQICERQNKE